MLATLRNGPQIPQTHRPSKVRAVPTLFQDTGVYIYI